MSRLGAAHTLRIKVEYVWLLALLLLGGTAQIRDIHTTIVNLLAALLLGYVALTDRYKLHLRGPMLLAFICFVAIAVQLVPIPFDLWRSMPGHGVYDRALTSAAIEPRPRPWSISPDLTLGALCSLLPILATIAVFRSLGKDRCRRLAWPILACVMLGTILGILQTGGGPETSLRFYRSSTVDGPTGFFSNRNHHALLLAIGISLTAIGMRDSLPRRWSAIARLSAGAGIVTALLVAIVLAGSRGALLLTIPGLILMAEFTRSMLVGLQPRAWRRLLIGAGVALAGLAIIAALLLSRSDRALAVVRLWQTSAGGELRWLTFEPIARIVRDFFPFGSGYGTFDTAFRAAEPHHLLKPTFLNEAHNEPLQVILEGGVIGGLLIVVGLIAVCQAVLASRKASRESNLYAATGLVILLQLGIASLFDYPLRTPFLAAIGLLAYDWISIARQEPHNRKG